MKAELNYEKLNRLLADFYTVTGQRIGIFDEEFHIILEYPKKHSEFCARIRSCPEGARRCRECDTYGMREAKKTHKTVTYRCHAGLLEVCSPIIDEEGISGFLMFGQVMYNRKIDQQRSEISRCCSDILSEIEFFQLFDGIRKITSDYLNATANIMAACVGYIQLEQLLKLNREDLWGRMKHYIEKRANQPFNLTEMADDLSVSISTLCKTAQSRAGKTVGKLVTEQRIERAKSLLVDENFTIADIAALVGIDDYNYFSRLFRKETGLSPTAYRQSNRY